VKTDGSIVDVNCQLDQLKDEGISILSNGRVDFNHCIPVTFKKERGFSESTEHSEKVMAGKFFLETYPALGNLGLFGYNNCPKYNPKRGTFSILDWKQLYSDIGLLATMLCIHGLPEYTLSLEKKSNPTKTDQDCLDAILSMINGYVWWHSGLQYSMVIGDSESGYMVCPCMQHELRSQLELDARRHEVPFDDYF